MSDLPDAMVNGIHTLLGHGYVMYKFRPGEAFFRQWTPPSDGIAHFQGRVAWNLHRDKQYARLSLVDNATTVEYASKPVWPDSAPMIAPRDEPGSF